jgi:predicted glycoside hydrolase/deacetylase ChbG (UPF0249 family)
MNVKYCIVNGDDFGAGRGVNRGILEAHERGVLTSTSLMMNMPGTREAIRLGRSTPSLSLGIHFNLTNEGDPIVDLEDVAACAAELSLQLERFTDRVGCLPTHLDAHHNIHRLPQLRPLFVELARKHGLPLRENCPVRYFSSFYGQWDGQSHLEHIGTSSLLRMLATEVGVGFTELSCHPGYADAEFESCYSVERETELATLCDPRIRAGLDKLDIRLVGYRDLPSLLEEAS